jgi:hypothetical protein
LFFRKPFGRKTRIFKQVLNYKRYFHSCQRITRRPFRRSRQSIVKRQSGTNT